MNNILGIKTPCEGQAQALKADYGLAYLGLTNLRKVYWNLPTEALYEEIVFRGYMFQRIRAWNRPTAIGATAILFSALHAGNGGVTAIALVNLTLAGVLLIAAGFLMTLGAAALLFWLGASLLVIGILRA